MSEQSQLIELDIHSVEDWREAATSLRLPLAIESLNGKFRARMRSLSVGGVRFYTVSATEHRSAPLEQLAQHGGEPYYVMVHQVTGRSRLFQAQRSAELERGDIAIFDTLMPYRREFVEGSTMLMMVPQQLISLPPHGFAQIGGLHISGNSGLGAVISPLLTGVSSNLGALQKPGGLVFAQAIVDMISACVIERLNLNVSGRSNSQLELLMKIREYIMANLGDLDLNPQRIADAHYISVRTLHALFKEQGATVSTWVRERRLEMARRDLIDPLCKDPIRQIGLRWGFADATHFSNAFRLAYEKSPREYRKFAREAAQSADASRT